MEDITSKQGENHVTSTQFRAILAAVLGSGSYIADQDDQLEPELAANNILNIRSGVLIHHGSVRRVPPGTYDQVAYLNGTQAMQRIDLVVVRYTKNGDIETSEWVVIQGTPAESDPEVPAHTEGNMQNGDLVDDCPVFELHFDGINVTEVKTLLDVISNVEAVSGKVANEFTAGRVLVSNASGKAAVSSATTADLGKLHNIEASSTELNYMKGVTSNVQDQINTLLTQQYYEKSITVPASSGGTSFTITAPTIRGYRVIGITGVTMPNNNALDLLAFGMASSTAVTVKVRNTSTAAVTETVGINILYAKSIG